MILNVGRLAFTLLTIGTMTGALSAQTVELVSRVHPSQVSDTAMDAILEDHQEGPFSEPSISADGRYVVFSNSAPNLVPNQKDMNLLEDTSGSDVFLKDLVTGATTLVSHSVSSPMTTGNGTSSGGVISADGRYVAFVSDATDLAPGQATGYYHVDLLQFDRITGATMVLASIRTFPRENFLGSLDISADGRYIAFVSDARDLVPGQQGGSGWNVFLSDRADRTIRLVSHVSSSTVTAGDGRSQRPRISADGRFIVFTSHSGDLVPGQLLTDNVFLYDRASEAVTLIGPGEEAKISADGKFVLFGAGFSTLQLYSREANTTSLVSDAAAVGASNSLYSLSADGRFAVYIHGEPRGFDCECTLRIYDRVTGTSTAASRPVVDHPRHIDALRISADGRFVVFTSADPDVVAGQADTNGGADVFLFDRSSGKTELVSSAPASLLTSANRQSPFPQISANGTRVVYASLATNLVTGVKDHNEGWDLFDYEVATKKTGLITSSSLTIPAVSSPRGSMAMVLSADGRFVAFESRSAHLVPGQIDSNGTTDIFLYDRTTRTTVLVSRGNASATMASNGESVAPSISGDGQYVTFASNATNLASGADDPEHGYDIFIFDRITGTSRLVALTRDGASPETSNWIGAQQISQNGRWVAFNSRATDLVPGQQEQDPSFPTVDVFLWDRITGSTTLVSRSLLGATITANNNSFLAELSPDGLYVSFGSSASDVVSGQVPDQGGFFIFHRPSRSAAPVRSSGSMSADGRFIVLVSDEPLDPNVGDNGWIGVYLHDRAQGTYRRIGFGNSYQPARISADGRYVAFVSSLPLLPDLNTSGFDRVYLYDRISDSLFLVSRSRTPGYSAAGDSHSPAISADGRYVTFVSGASDLIPGQVRSFGQDRDDVYLFDRLLGTITLVSRWRGSAVTTSGGTSGPQISANGRQVAFTSSADLVAGDFNDNPDTFLFSLDPAGPIPLPTCKLLDTRRRADRPVLTSNVQRAVTVRGTCGVPATAKQIVVKVTVFNPSGKGNLRFYPGAVTATPSGILRFERGATRTETLTLPLSANGTLTVLPFVAGRGTVHMAVEVTGYSQ